MITIAESAFDPARALEAFRAANPGCGAIVSFVGGVRARAYDGGSLETLRLEHFPGVTERSIAAIVDAACTRWEISAVSIVHRVGDLAPGEAVVFVAVGAPHRRAALEAADFVMDYLKTEALFWKKEISDRGETWIDPRGDDYKDAARWND
ncbi:MAG: molybdenum cofactor biosynthesis protein MoaE [Pseudomonadota bacterium]